MSPRKHQARTGKVVRWLKSRKGQTLVEYAIIIAIISVVTVAVLFSLGNKVKMVTTTISSQLAIAASSH